MTRYILFLYFLMFSVELNAAQSFLRPVSFPTTSSDSTFVAKSDNATSGYVPFAEKSAYVPMSIESEAEFINRIVRTADIQRTRDAARMTKAEYCAEYPLDSELCPQAPGLYESIVAIGDRPTSGTQPQPSQPQPSQPQSSQPTTPSQPTPSVQKPTIGGRTYGATCTPPQHNNVFINKILTTGRYATIDPAFEKAMITVFRAEGECINDPDDSGGDTCYGISQRNNPEINVRNITRADAEDIAYNKYYKAYNIDKLPDDSRGNVFMLGWGGGPVTGIRRFCKFLKISERNQIDSEIITTAENYPGDIHNDFLDEQQRFYIEIANQGNNRKFLKGWMNRIRLMRENGCHSETTSPITR